FLGQSGFGGDHSRLLLPRALHLPAGRPLPLAAVSPVTHDLARHLRRPNRIDLALSRPLPRLRLADGRNAPPPLALDAFRACALQAHQFVLRQSDAVYGIKGERSLLALADRARAHCRAGRPGRSAEPVGALASRLRAAAERSSAAASTASRRLRFLLFRLFP